MADSINRTAESVEKRCTLDVLKRAVLINSQVGQYLERDDIFKTVPFAKAIRTTFKSNRHLFRNIPRQPANRVKYPRRDPQDRRQPVYPMDGIKRFPEKRRHYPPRQTRFSHTDTNRHRPSYRSYRDDDEFPEIEQVDHDYRRYKRDHKDPQYRHIKQGYAGEYDSDDDVFSDCNFRTYRNYRY